MGLSSSKQWPFCSSVAHCHENKEPDFFSSSGHSQNNQAELLLKSRDFHEANPGTYDEILKALREVGPIPFEGFKCSFNNTVNNNFQIAHNISIANEAPSKYCANFTYVGHKQVRAYENVPLLMAEVDSSMNLGANFLHYIGNDLRIRFQGQTRGSKWENTDFSAAYFGESFSYTVGLQNPDIINKSGSLSIQYFKRIMKNLDIGTECSVLLHGGTSMISPPSFAIRATHGINTSQVNDNSTLLPSLSIQPKGTVIAHIGPSNFHLTYHRYVCAGLQMLVDYECGSNMMGKSSVVSVAYMAQIPKSGITIKSSVDSTMSVVSSVEKHFENIPIALNASFGLNYKTNRSVVGLGITLGK